jgi:molecular chaperone DnaK
MQCGYPVGPVLIDVATHTLGIAAIESEYRQQLTYVPLVHRNTPLPARFKQTFYTTHEGQEQVRISVFQGESPQLNQNRLLGSFDLDGLKGEQSHEAITVEFNLTLDGVLKVTAMEKQTGLSEQLLIDNALSQMSNDERSASIQRLVEMFQGSAEFQSNSEGDAESYEDYADEAVREVELDADSRLVRIDAVEETATGVNDLEERAKRLRGTLSTSDRDDLDRVIAAVERAREKGDEVLVAKHQQELDDLLFYLAD